MSNPFMLYAMECEGETTTKRGRMNKLIKILAAAPDPDDPDTQERAFEEAGLSNYDLTEEDERYIINEIRRRR